MRLNTKFLDLLAVVAGVSSLGGGPGAALAAGGKEVLHESELIFSLETWHNHASTLVETPSGDLLVCWFHGSGERTADDVRIEGARLRRGAREWSGRQTSCSGGLAG